MRFLAFLNLFFGLANAACVGIDIAYGLSIGYVLMNAIVAGLNLFVANVCWQEASW